MEVEGRGVGGPPEEGGRESCGLRGAAEGKGLILGGGSKESLEGADRRQLVVRPKIHHLQRPHRVRGGARRGQPALPGRGRGDWLPLSRP